MGLLMRVNFVTMGLVLFTSFGTCNIAFGCFSEYGGVFVYLLVRLNFVGYVMCMLYMGIFDFVSILYVDMVDDSVRMRVRFARALSSAFGRVKESVIWL